MPSQTETGETSAQRRTVLVVGGGGREHALAWRLARSPSVARVLVCPGNGGTVGERIERVTDVAIDADSLLALARRERVDLTVIGPEAPLAAGVVDAFEAAGLPCFGPTAAATEIEASKAFSKAFMLRHGIPTARGEAFDSVDVALARLDLVGMPIVVKAAGLMAGKGVVVCDTREQAVDAIERLGARGPLVLEDKLVGEELSVMALSDGEAVRVMPAVQDHKAIYEGDRGPNTGGMGAYTPVPAATPEVLAAVERDVIRPAIAGLAAEGRTFRGVLYAGVMVTPGGVKVLEFNARFGDPETQVVLPLLEGDLAEILLACARGDLGDLPVTFSDRACATVVAASAGYPGAYEKGRVITGVDDAEKVGLVFHAGTDRAGDRLVTSGGRVLAATGLGDRLEDAVATAYAALDQVRFDGLYARRDIAHRALGPRSAYAAAGVDIDAANRAVRGMKGAIEATHTRYVLNTVGAFGGLFDAAALADYDHPVLVASTDGVGTKTMIAAAADRWDTIGVDLVNHCVDDILVQGARPLFFLDYVASARLEGDRVETVVKGVAAACAAAGCALLGGETAEMPGVYQPGELDLAGTIVGVVDKARIIDGSAIAPGDVVLALPSHGLHTNGFSLARHILRDVALDDRPPELGGATWAEALLAPHRSYLPDVERLWAADVHPKGLAHITGGGLVENPPRVLPHGTAITLDTGAWSIPPLFTLLQRLGGVADDEMRRVFNLGLGMLVVLAPDDVARARVAHAELIPVGAVVDHAGRPPVVRFEARP